MNTNSSAISKFITTPPVLVRSTNSPNNYFLRACKFAKINGFPPPSKLVRVKKHSYPPSIYDLNSVKKRLNIVFEGDTNQKSL